MAEKYFFFLLFIPAYHYPYTYSRMKANLDTISNKVPENMYLKIDWLAESLGKKNSKNFHKIAPKFTKMHIFFAKVLLFTFL